MEIVKQLDLAALPTVDFANRDRLPNLPGLYFVLKNGSPIYIGKAQKSFKTRWLTHHRSLELNELQSQGKIEIAYWDLSGVSENLRAVEDAACRFFNPALNGTRVLMADGAVGDNRLRIASLGEEYEDLLKIGAELEGKTIAQYATAIIQEGLDRERASINQKVEYLASKRSISVASMWMQLLRGKYKKMSKSKVKQLVAIDPFTE